MNRYSIFAIIALICSYAPGWAKVYVDMFGGQKNDRTVEFVHELKKDGATLELIASTSLKPDDAGRTLSLGVVWPIPSILCDGREFDISGNAIAIDKNSVTAVRIPTTSTCSDLKIAYRQTPGYFLLGPISGRAFIADSATVASYKRIVDFLFRDLRLLLLIVAVMYVLVLLLTRSHGQSEIPLNPLERYAVPWGLFLLSSAGVFEIFVPWEGAQKYLPRLNSYLSAVAHVGPGIDYILWRFWKRKSNLAYVLIGFGFIAIVPNRMLALISLGIPVGLVAFLSTLKSPYVGPFRYYSALLVLNLFKLLGLPEVDSTLLPHIHLVSIYIGLVMGGELGVRIKTFSRVSGFISWANNNRSSSRGLDRIYDALEQALIAVGARKVTLVVSREDKCEMHVVRTLGRGLRESETKNLERLPPLFAAVITSDSAVWMIDEASQKASNLRKNRPATGEGYFSVVPLNMTETGIGAIAFSGLECAEKGSLVDAHKSTCEIVVKHIEILLSEIEEQTSARLNEGLVAAAEYFSGAEGTGGTRAVIERSLAKFSEEMESQAVLFAYDEEQQRFSPSSVVNLAGKESVLASDLHIPITESNEHGPFVICVRTRKSVVVNNLALIGDVLSKRTRNYFEECSTESIITIPVLESESASISEKVSFVLMLQSRKRNHFDLRNQSLVARYVRMLENFLRLQSSEAIQERQLRVLAEFVPDGITERVISGAETRISSRGFLGCIDIVGSSALLAEYGDEWFRSLTRNLVEQVKGAHLSAKLVSMNWDAFYFESSSVQQMVEIYDLFTKSLSKFTDINGRSQELLFRLCVSYGDTSQDFCEANGFKRWTVVGAAMAAVCKFEQAVKVRGCGIFFDSLSREKVGSELIFQEFQIGGVSYYKVEFAGCSIAQVA